MTARALAPMPSPERRAALPVRTQIAIFLRLLAIQGSWNYEILLGNGIGFCLEPALRLLPEGIHSQHFKDALARESKYFNAHPYLASVAVGAVSCTDGAAIADIGDPNTIMKIMNKSNNLNVTLVNLCIVSSLV